MKNIWMVRYLVQFVAGWIIAWLLAACAVVDLPRSELVTKVPLLATAGVTRQERSVSAAIQSTPAAPVASSGDEGPSVSLALAQDNSTPDAIQDGSGIRPDQVQYSRPPDINQDSPIEWRPPPVAVPHALDPSDHYWLLRPLPSGSRNYELEWYTYGIEPMLPEALPYRVHHGSDFPNDTGTPVFAAASGDVIWAGPLPSARNGVNYYGNTVIIRHDWQWLGKEVYTLYAHTLELFVEVGDYVDQGQLIAGVGASGEVSGPHLHLEVRVGSNNYGSTRNPALWLAPYEGWGTLAGRFVDERGRMIPGAVVTVNPVLVSAELDVPVRRQRTYFRGGINSDELWRENFVFGDLPTGQFTVLLSAAGRTFRRSVQILPGRTNFIVVQADFEYIPTATPPPTPTATATPDA